MDFYNEDNTRKSKGDSSAVLFPATNEELSAILKHCNERLIAVVPQGGNTGLVMGSNPIFDEVVISMKRMNKVIGFDENYGIAKFETGVIL
jgi:(R)-2-hydroxyglutarate---pyruvate transhydrogenase